MFQGAGPAVQETGVTVQALVARRGETHRVGVSWALRHGVGDSKFAVFPLIASPHDSSSQLAVTWGLKYVARRQVDMAPEVIRMGAGPPETVRVGRRNAVAGELSLRGEDTERDAKASWSRYIALSPSSPEDSTRWRAVIVVERTQLAGLSNRGG